MLSNLKKATQKVRLKPLRNRKANKTRIILLYLQFAQGQMNSLGKSMGLQGTILMRTELTEEIRMHMV